MVDSEHEAQDELVEICGNQYRVHPVAAVFPFLLIAHLAVVLDMAPACRGRRGRRR